MGLNRSAHIYLMLSASPIYCNFLYREHVFKQTKNLTAHCIHVLDSQKNIRVSFEIVQLRFGFIPNKAGSLVPKYTSS